MGVCRALVGGADDGQPLLCQSLHSLSNDTLLKLGCFNILYCQSSLCLLQVSVDNNNSTIMIEDFLFLAFKGSDLGGTLEKRLLT